VIHFRVLHTAVLVSARSVGARGPALLLQVRLPCNASGLWLPVIWAGLIGRLDTGAAAAAGW
jgi:hypothetical protein